MTATRGPCTAWDPIWCCDLSGSSPAITGYALTAATEILYNLTAQTFDICEFTVRPCRRDCTDNFWGGGIFGGYGLGNWWEWGGLWPRPAIFNGAWYNLTCGGCGGSCSCNPLSEAWLPSPVSSIVSVKLDGQVMPITGYRVDNFRLLVRTDGGVWPICQDLTLADTQPNTWSVTVRVGEETPVSGRLAVGELACEIIKACTGQACAIPKNATTITRQGVTIDFATFTDLLRDGLVGLRFSDMFIATYNPQRLLAVPQVYDVDAEAYRRTNT